MAISSGLGSSALLPAGLGFRNVIINGGFDIWQRGTAATTIAITSSSAFLADRWQATRSVSGSKQSQISAGLDGFRYGMRIQRDSGNTSTTAIYLSQSFEGDVAIKLANKPVVLSFYARAGSNYSPTSSFLTVGLGCGTGSEANIIYSSFTGYTLPVNSNITLTTSWQRFTFIVNIPSGTTQAGLYFAMTPVGTASTNDYFEITGVQLEQNLQPTPFEQRPIGVELQLCQRYYQIIIQGQTEIGIGAAYTSTDIRVGRALPVTMRKSPVASVVTGTAYWIIYANSAGRTDYTINTTFDVAAPTYVSLQFTNGTAFTTGSACLVRGNNASAFIAANAEL
jgi:hypothetical protein